MNNGTGPKRSTGGAGIVGMGRGNSAQSDRKTSVKILPTEVLQKRNDKIGVKSRKLEKAQAGFAARARQSKSDEPKEQ